MTNKPSSVDEQPEKMFTWGQVEKAFDDYGEDLIIEVGNKIKKVKPYPNLEANHVAQEQARMARFEASKTQIQKGLDATKDGMKKILFGIKEEKKDGN